MVRVLFCEAFIIYVYIPIHNGPLYKCVSYWDKLLSYSTACIYRASLMCWPLGEVLSIK